MDESVVKNWVDSYIQAWNSNDPAEIGGLFSEDARYFTGPFDEPWKGRQVIVDKWLARKDEPGTTSFRYEVLAVQDNLGVVRGWTEYFQPPAQYSTLWVIRFDEAGRCTEFTEWWVRR